MRIVTQLYNDPHEYWAKCRMGGDGRLPEEGFRKDPQGVSDALPKCLRLALCEFDCDSTNSNTNPNVVGVIGKF